MIRSPMFQLAFLLAVSAGLAAPKSARADEPFTVDAILPMTGNASFVGIAHRQVAELAAKAMNERGGMGGRPFAFHFHDDQTSPQVAVQVTNQLLASRPPVILGSSLVAMCNAEAPLVKNGPVTYCISPGIYPPAGSYMFSGGVATKDLLRTLVGYIRNRGWTRIASLTSTDATGQDVESAFDDIMNSPENKGVKLVQRSRFALGDISLAAQMTQIKEAHPDILIAWTTGGAIASVFKSALQAGLDVPIATTNGNQANAIMEQFKAFLPKELYVPTSMFPNSEGFLEIDPRLQKEQQAFYAAMQAGRLPVDYMSASIWDVAIFTLSALQKLGPNATANEVRDYFNSQTELVGANGRYDFKAAPQRGLDSSDAIMTRWDASSQKWVVVSGPAGEQPIRE